MADEEKVAAPGQPKTTRVKKAVDGLLAKAQVADLSKAPGPKKVITMSAIKQFIEDLLAQYGGSEGIQRAIADLAQVQLERDQLKDKLVALEAKLKSAADAAAGEAEALRKQLEAARGDLDERTATLMADHAAAVRDFEVRLRAADEKAADAEKRAAEEVARNAAEVAKRAADAVKALQDAEERAAKLQADLDKEVKEHFATEEKLADAMAEIQDVKAKLGAIEVKLGEFERDRDDLAAWTRRLAEALTTIKAEAEKGLALTSHVGCASDAPS